MNYPYRELACGDDEPLRKFERSRSSIEGRDFQMDEIGLAFAESIGGSFLMA